MSEFTGYEAVVFTIGVFGATFLIVYWLLDRLFGSEFERGAFVAPKVIVPSDFVLPSTAPIPENPAATVDKAPPASLRSPGVC